jgi:hypothetical protein
MTPCRRREEILIMGTSSSSQRTLQESVTSLSATVVLSAAKEFFSSRPSLYSAFLDKEGPNFCTFRGQGGEEIVIGVAPAPDGNGTRVTGSTYLFDMQISRFLSMLPPVSAS